MQGPDRVAVEAVTIGGTGRIGLIGGDRYASENDSAHPANVPMAFSRVEIIAYACSHRPAPDCIGVFDVAEGVAAFGLSELPRVQALRIR